MIDIVYYPVASSETSKFLMSFCSQNDLIIEQMDIETAFLNDKVSTEVYIRQPQGYEDGTDPVCKLVKSMYGLSESPRDWFDCFDEFVTTEKISVHRLHL